MNIGGALGVIGNAMLQGYSWGSTVMAIVNSHLPADAQITVLETGNRVSQLIYQFDPAVANAVLAIDIGPLEGPATTTTSPWWTLQTVTVGVAILLVLTAITLTSINNYVSPNAVPGAANAQIFDFVLNIVKELLKIPNA